MGTPTSNSTTSDVTNNDRVKASIENWKRKLLDLTKRNRALNFKVHKVSTITVVDEQPAEVFRQLYLREKSMRFKAAPESDNPKKTPEQNGSIFQTVYLDQPDVDGQLVESDAVSLVFEEDDEDEGLHQDFGMVLLHRAARPQNFKLRVKSEECLQQILLRPET